MVYFILFFFSIQEFVKDSSSFARGVVHKLLDVLTDGAHSQYITKMKEVNKIKIIRLDWIISQHGIQ